MKTKPTKHKALNTFKVLPFAERISEIDIDVFHRIHSKNEEEEEDELCTSFHGAIQKWNVMNLSVPYDEFRRELPNGQTLTLLLNQKDKILEVIIKHLKKCDSLSLQTILDILTALIKDLRYEICPSLPTIIRELIGLLSVKDPEQLEWIFTCLAYIFKFLWKYLLEKIPVVLKLLLPLFSDSRPYYIQNFAAESFAFVARKAVRRGVKNDEKISSFLQLLLTTVQRNDEVLEGLGRLLFEVMKGTKGSFHSCAKEFLECTMELLYKKDVDRDLLSSMFNYTIYSMRPYILPKNMELYFDVLFDVANRHLTDSEGSDEALCHNFKFIEMALIYKQGVFLVDAAVISNKVEELFTSLEEKKDVVAILSQITVAILSSKMPIPYHCSMQLATKLINIPYEDIILDTISKLIVFPCFEAMFLRFLEKFSSQKLAQFVEGKSELNKSVLRTLTQVVLTKAHSEVNTKTFSGFGYKDWKPYKLDISSKGVAFESVLQKTIFSSPDFIMQEYESSLCILLCLPRVTLNETNAVNEGLKHLVEWLTDAIRSEGINTNCFQEEAKLQKLLFLYRVVLETVFRVVDNETWQTFITHQIVIDTLLPYVKLPQYISALYALDLFITVSKNQNLNADVLPLIETLWNVVAENLTSPFHKMRLVTIHILLGLMKNKESVSKDLKKYLKICFAAESVRPDLNNFREKLMYLEKLTYEHLKGLNASDCQLLVQHLLGVFHENFQQLWKPVKLLIASYANGMPASEFWSVLHGQLTFAAQQVRNVLHTPVQISTDWEVLDLFYNNIHKMDDRPNYAEYRILLWDSLGEFVDVCEMKNRDLVTLFFEYWSLYDKGDDDDRLHWDIKAREKKDEDMEVDTTEHKEQQVVKSGTPAFKTLLAHLQIFSKFRNPLAVFREPEMKEKYYYLLGGKNPLLQKVALDCLMAYKEKYLTPYKDHIYGLLNDDTFKSQLPVFRIDRDTTVIHSDHRQRLLPLVIRILFGKMRSKTGRHTGGKASAGMRRSLVLRFMTGCYEEEMMIFLKLTFEIYEPFFQDDPGTMVKNILSSADMMRVISLKKLQSSLNMLLVVYDTFGSLMGPSTLNYLLNVLFCIGSMVVSMYSHREELYTGFLTALKNLRSACINCINRFFNRFPDFVWTAEVVDAVFDVFVWPYLSKLPMEGIHSPTALLKLFMCWGSNPRYFILLTKHQADNDKMTPLPFIMELLLCEKSKAPVRTMIMRLVESLLTMEDYEEPMEVEGAEKSKAGPKITEEIVGPVHQINRQRIGELKEKVKDRLNFGTCILLDHISPIVNYLRWKLGKLKKILNKREMLIMSRSCELVNDEQISGVLLQLLFPLIQRKSSASEDVILHLVNTMCSLIKNVPNRERYIRSIAPLLGSISVTNIRKLLLGLLSDVGKESNNDLLRQNIDIIIQMNAWDAKWIEQPDFNRRLDAFNKIHEMIESNTIHADCGIVMVHCCTSFLRNDKDMAMRSASSHCLSKLAPHLFTMKSYKQDNFVHESLFNIISNGIRKGKYEYYQEIVTLLGELVRECGEEHPILKDLVVFSNKVDQEVDFFCNIVHLQTHRRNRALAKFCETAKQLKKTIHPRALTHFIVPVISNFLCNEKNIGKHSLIDAAIQSLAVCCRLLPCHHYMNVLRNYTNMLKGEHVFQKQVIRVVAAILDSFHFDLSASKRTGLKDNLPNKDGEEKATDVKVVDEEKKEEEEKSEGVEKSSDEKEKIGDEEEKDEDDENGEEKDEEEEVEEEEDEDNKSDDEDDNEKDNEEVVQEDTVSEEPACERQVKLVESAADRVIETLSKGLLPQLRAAVGTCSKSDHFHKKNKKVGRVEYEEEDVMRVPLAFPVVKLLQKLPAYFLKQYLPGIFMNICTFLKSRMMSIRKVAKETLQQIMQSLGPSYLNVLLHEISALLTRGFQVHVLINVTNVVLGSLVDLFQPGDVDKCLAKILEICHMDLFGPASEEKDVQKLMSKVTEACSNKTYNSLKIAAKYITDKCLVDLVLPFKKVLASTLDYKIVCRVKESLRNIFLGLVENTYIELQSLFIFIYGVATFSIPALQFENNREQKEKTSEDILLERRPDIFLLPEAPRSRYGAVNTKPSTTKDANSHYLVEFVLSIFHSVLKRKTTCLGEYNHFIDPLVKVLLENMDVKHVQLTSVTVSCLSYMLKLDLPTLKKEIGQLTTNLFLILHKYAASGVSQGDYSEMVIATFKAVTVLVRDVQYHKINTEQLKALVLYIEQYIHDFSRQSTSFTLMRAILARKLLSPEIDEVMTKVAKLSIVSENDNVRLQSRQLFHQYLMNYPMKGKLDQHVNFFLLQLSFELEHGRSSALEMIYSMISTFPHEVLSKFCGVFLMSLGASLVNDSTPDCRKMVAKCLKMLFTRCNKDDLEKLYNMIMLWFSDLKVLHCQMGAQLVGIFIEVVKESFSPHVGRTLPVLVNQICAMNSSTPGKYVKVLEENTPLDEKQQRKEDHRVFQVLQTIQKLCTHCPSFLKSSEWTDYVRNIAESAEFLLAHEHEWIRVKACVVLGIIFSNIDIAKVVEAAQKPSPLFSDMDGPYLLSGTKRKLKSLVLDFCSLLEPEKTGKALAEQVVKNLVFLSRVIQELPQKNKRGKENEEKDVADINDIDMDNDAGLDNDLAIDDDDINISLLWMIKRMRKIVYMEIINTPSEFNLREAVFKWIGAVVVTLDSEKLLTVLPHLLGPLVRELSNEKDCDPNVLKMTRDICKLMKKKVGTEKYTSCLSKQQMLLSARRAKRKMDRAALAIAEPEKAARRKIKKHQQKKVQRKRKIDEFKGRIAPKRRRKKADVEEFE